MFRVQRLIVRCRAVAAAGLLLVLLPGPAFPWGSVAPAKTHLHILNQALAQLQADPAFSPELFPLLSDVQSYEGVEWTAIGLQGNGPDAAGRSKYAQHYYNPVTGEGDGPNAAAEYYGYLAKGVATRTREGAPRAAAWSAHFLADMFVPYHVVGTTRDRAIQIFEEQRAKNPGVINLGHSITGSDKLSFLTPIKGGNPNFYTELYRFRFKTDGNEADWFDPWYYNGNTDAGMVKTSSHVAWEAYPKHLPYRMAGYSPYWTNAAPRFQEPWAAHADRVRELAKQSAKDTRELLESYFDKPEPAIDKAIQAVYTIWRSTLSGLRPTLSWTPNADGTYAVTGTVANAATAEVSGLRLRLSVTGGGTLVTTGDQGLSGSVASGATIKTMPWTVKPTGGQLCKLKLEVIGTYRIPDLQYAAAERSFFAEATTPRPPAPPAPPPSQPPPLPIGKSVAVKGQPDQWAHIQVSLDNVGGFKTEDRPGWRNNGTGFTAKSGAQPVQVRIDIAGKSGVSYFDYKVRVSVKHKASGKDLLSRDEIISKDGGTKTYSCSWDPKTDPGSVSLSVQVTGGNPESFTYFVSGGID